VSLSLSTEIKGPAVFIAHLLGISLSWHCAISATSFSALALSNGSLLVAESLETGSYTFICQEEAF
jgi:hypothetical protein